MCKLSALFLLQRNDLLTFVQYFLYSVNAPGVAADLSHINTPSVVTGYLPKDNGLAGALKNADIVVIPAGVPRKPGMTRDDLFNVSLSPTSNRRRGCHSSRRSSQNGSEREDTPTVFGIC